MRDFKRLLASVRGLERQSAADRRQSERDDARHGDRGRQSESEFDEERAGEAALKADRHIDGDQHDRHGDDRSGEFARRQQRGVDRRQTFAEMPVDVFDDDDGVVDHEADRQHQRQKRQQIDREAESEEKRQ